MCCRPEGQGGSQGESLWKESELFQVEAACGLYSWAKDCLDSVGVQEGLPSFVVSYEDKFHRPFDRLEFHGRVVRLTMDGYEAHVSRRDANESEHVCVSSYCL